MFGIGVVVVEVLTSVVSRLSYYSDSGDGAYYDIDGSGRNSNISGGIVIVVVIVIIIVEVEIN